MPVDVGSARQGSESPTGLLTLKRCRIFPKTSVGADSAASAKLEFWEQLGRQKAD